MLVKQIFVDNPLRNFNYLIACGETGEALVIDPLDVGACLDAAKSEGWEIRQILNTHEHHDHIGGNEGIVAATDARILAHAGAASRIPDMSVGLNAGDEVRVGKSIALEVLDTPGHTMSHVCVLAHPGAGAGDTPALFCGDTLFNAGAGNCKGGGHPEALYSTFSEQLARLPEETRIYPGHDYLETNLRFTLDREPDNETARAYLARMASHDPHKAPVTTLSQERKFNTFFRLSSASVIARLRETFPDFPDDPTEKDVFLALRELRNSW